MYDLFQVKKYHRAFGRLQGRINLHGKALTLSFILDREAPHGPADAAIGASIQCQRGTAFT